MSKIHVLRIRNGRADLVVHFDVPSGTNSAGKLWSECIVNAGAATTSLAEGTGAGQISTAEKAAVEAGTVYEFRTQIPYESGGGGAASVHAMVDPKITAHTAELAAQLERFGQELN